MKKTRILAGFLCIMMMVCSIPIIHVSATGVNDDALMTAIGEVMGYTNSAPANDNTNWKAVNMDFSNGFTSTSAMTVSDGITYDENGINFPSGEAKTWTYTEQVSGMSHGGWSPLCVSYNYTFRFKLDAGGQLENYAPRIWGVDNVGVDFTATPDKIEFLSNGNPVHNPDRSPITYVPGTDWNDVLVKYIGSENGQSPNIRMGYEVWMKKSSETSFVKLGAGASFSPGPEWANTGLTFTGNGAHVKFAVSAAEKVETPTPGPGTDPTPTPTPTPGELATPETVAASNRTIWLDEDFSGTSISSNWDLLYGMEHDTENDYLSVGESLGQTEAYYSLEGLPLGLTWTTRFKMKFDAGHTGGITGIFADGKDRFYWGVNPDEKKITAQGPGTASGVVTEIDQWYEYLFRFYEIDGGKGVSLYRRLEGASTWTPIYSGYKYVDSINNNGAPPSWRILGGAASDFSIDDVRIYQGVYAKLDEPVISGTDVTVTGVFDNSDPGMDEKRNVTLMAVVFDKERGYAVDVEKELITVNNGVKEEINKTFSFPGLDTSKHSVVVMVWDAVENGIPLALASGDDKAYTEALNPEEGQEPAITATASYNEVKLAGYLGQAYGQMTASLMKNGEVYGAIQETANKSGMITTILGIDPESPSGEYILRVQYGNNVATETPVSLTCNDAIPGTGINSPAELESFINTYGDEATKALLQTEGILPYMYGQFQKIVTNEDYVNVYAIRPVLEEAAKNGEDELDLITRVNQAVITKSWADIEELVAVTYADLIGMPENPIGDINSSKDLFLRMTGGYVWAADVLSDFNAAHLAQKNAEAAGGSMPGGFVGSMTGGATGGAGGGGGFVSSNSNEDFSIENGIIPETETGFDPAASKEFNDLEAVPWAKDSIRALQLEGIISGDGTGGFAPDRAISREEFLKLAMLAAGIQGNETSNLDFRDVDINAWYAPYIAAAYEMGIVKGVSDTEFGIGRQITRADMAVILKRILDAINVEAVPVKAAYRFDDGLEIPDYAIDDVAALCEAELLNGMGDNQFKPMASATRAESAVAIFRIFNYIREGRN